MRGVLGADQRIVILANRFLESDNLEGKGEDGKACFASLEVQSTWLCVCMSHQICKIRKHCIGVMMLHLMLLLSWHAEWQDTSFCCSTQRSCGCGEAAPEQWSCCGCGGSGDEFYHSVLLAAWRCIWSDGMPCILWMTCLCSSERTEHGLHLMIVLKQW